MTMTATSETKTTMADVFEARQRLAGWIWRTPLVYSDWLSRATGANVRLKLEALQPTRSFKIRGAVNIALSMREQYKDGNVPRLVTASSGNHGRALAHAAQALGLECVVFAPANTPAVKLDAIRDCAATLNAESRTYDEAESSAQKFAVDNPDAVFVSAYSDERIVAATGTIGVEICEDDPLVDIIVVPIGGGGLISGIARAAKALRPSVKVIGVEAAHNPSLHTARARGAMTTIETKPTLADAIAGNNDPDTITFAYIQQFVDDIVLVSEEEIAAAVRDFAGRERLIVEGGGAVGAAALVAKRIESAAAGAGKRIAVVVSGSNIDLSRLAPILAS
jgi:threonine dehydratase